jgi:hypothetical protein
MDEQPVRAAARKPANPVAVKDDVAAKPADLETAPDREASKPINEGKEPTAVREDEEPVKSVA